MSKRLASYPDEVSRCGRIPAAPPCVGGDSQILKSFGSHDNHKSSRSRLVPRAKPKCKRATSPKSKAQATNAKSKPDLRAPRAKPQPRAPKQAPATRARAEASRAEQQLTKPHRRAPTRAPTAGPGASGPRRYRRGWRGGGGRAAAEQHRAHQGGQLIGRRRALDYPKERLRLRHEASVQERRQSQTLTSAGVGRTVAG